MLNKTPMEFLMQKENSHFNALQDLPINIGKMSRNKSVPACLPDMQTTKMTKEPDGSFMRKAISPMRPNSQIREAAINCRRHFRHAARFPAYNREISDVTQKRATTGAWSLGRSQPRGTLSM